VGLRNCSISTGRAPRCGCPHYGFLGERSGSCVDLAEVGRQADGDRLERLSGNAGGRGADDGLLATPRDDDLLETVEVEARPAAIRPWAPSPRVI